MVINAIFLVFLVIISIFFSLFLIKSSGFTDRVFELTKSNLKITQIKSDAQLKWVASGECIYPGNNLQGKGACKEIYLFGGKLFSVSERIPRQIKVKVSKKLKK